MALVCFNTLGPPLDSPTGCWDKFGLYKNNVGSLSLMLDKAFQKVVETKNDHKDNWMRLFCHFAIRFQTLRQCLTNNCYSITLRKTSKTSWIDMYQISHITIITSVLWTCFEPLKRWHIFVSPILNQNILVRSFFLFWIHMINTIHILLFHCGDRLRTWTFEVYRRQMLTCKVGPCTERVSHCPLLVFSLQTTVLSG